MGIPMFACTPPHFPDLMAASLNRQDMHLWAQRNGLKLERGEAD
jgi:hypothetical protein